MSDNKKFVLVYEGSEENMFEISEIIKEVVEETFKNISIKAVAESLVCAVDLPFYRDKLYPEFPIYQAAESAYREMFQRNDNSTGGDFREFSLLFSHDQKGNLIAFVSATTKLKSYIKDLVEAGVFSVAEYDSNKQDTTIFGVHEWSNVCSFNPPENFSGLTWTLNAERSAFSFIKDSQIDLDEIISPKERAIREFSTKTEIKIASVVGLESVGRLRKKIQEVVKSFFDSDEGENIPLPVSLNFDLNTTTFAYLPDSPYVADEETITFLAGIIIQHIQNMTEEEKIAKGLSLK